MEWTRNMKSFSQQLVSGQCTCNNSGRHALPAVSFRLAQFTHACMHVCMYVCMYVCMCGCGCGCRCGCGWVCMCVCMWTYSLSELHIYSSLPFVFILFVYIYVLYIYKPPQTKPERFSPYGVTMIENIFTSGLTIPFKSIKRCHLIYQSRHELEVNSLIICHCRHKSKTYETFPAGNGWLDTNINFSPTECYNEVYGSVSKLMHSYVPPVNNLNDKKCRPDCRWARHFICPLIYFKVHRQHKWNVFSVEPI